MDDDSERPTSGDPFARTRLGNLSSGNATGVPAPESAPSTHGRCRHAAEHGAGTGAGPRRSSSHTEPGARWRLAAAVHRQRGGAERESHPADGHLAPTGQDLPSGTPQRQKQLLSPRYRRKFTPRRLECRLLRRFPATSHGVRIHCKVLSPIALHFNSTTSL